MNTLLSALPSSAVTGGNWDGPGPWWPIIPLLWLLLVVSVIATFAYVGRRRWRQLNAQAGQRAGEARLAERFAAGEIEEREYEQRLATLKRLGRSG